MERSASAFSTVYSEEVHYQGRMKTARSLTLSHPHLYLPPFLRKERFLGYYVVQKNLSQIEIVMS